MAPSSPAAVSFGLLLAGSVVASACTTASNVDPYVQTSGGPLGVSVTTEPEPRADGTIPRNARFIVQLDGYPDPDSVSYGPLTLRSGQANFDIDVSIRFVARQVVVTPRTLLAPSVQYDLVASGLVSLDDRFQGDDVVGTFRVGTDDGDPFPAPTVRTWNGDIRAIASGRARRPATPRSARRRRCARARRRACST